MSAVVGMLLAAPTAAGTPPEITVTVFGTLGSNGWYRSNVTINWRVSGAESSSGCDAVTLTADTLGTKVTCTAFNGGDQTSKTVTIKLDKTPPTAAPVPERSPDANGWYNRPLAVSWTGTDATAGMEGCSSGQYAGPDNGDALITGSCRDLAGNMTDAPFRLRYDATAPGLFGVTTKRGNRSAQISWRKSSDTALIEILRTPGRAGAGETVVYRGSETGYRDTGLVVGQEYEYRVAAVDEAGNRTEQKVHHVGTGALLRPGPGERVASPPILVWTSAKRASYYNVQLIRRGKRVLSVWPADPSYRLRRTWSYKGRRYLLRPGLYRWYVWPGLGRRSAAKYGRQLGSSTFVVTK